MIHLIASLFLLSTLTVRAGWVSDGLPMEPASVDPAVFTNLMPRGVVLSYGSYSRLGFADAANTNHYVMLAAGEDSSWGIRFGDGSPGGIVDLWVGATGKLYINDYAAITADQVSELTVGFAGQAEYANRAESANSADSTGYAQSAETANSANWAQNAGYANEAGSVQSLSGRNLGELNNDVGYVNTEGATAAAQAWVEANDYVQSQSLGGASVDHANRADYANSAESANSANYAASAGNASTADNANYANFAGTANSANSCENANEATHAQNAGYAESAGSAQTANSASSADSAQYANSAGSAESVNSLSGHSLGELNNDVGYISSAELPGASVAYAGSAESVNSLSGHSLSELSNDSGYVTPDALSGASVASAVIAETVVSLTGHSLSELSNDPGYLTGENLSWMGLPRLESDNIYAAGTRSTFDQVQAASFFLGDNAFLRVEDTDLLFITISPPTTNRVVLAPL